MVNCADCGKEMGEDWDYQSPLSDKYFCENCAEKPVSNKSTMERFN